MQNKPNLVRRRRIANSVYTMNYENNSNWTLGQNKPNSNPISSKPNFFKGQNERKIACRKIRPHLMFLTAKKFLALTAEVEYNNSKRDAGCSRKW